MLRYPEYWHLLTSEYVKENSNGCGCDKTKNFVPDHLFGVTIKKACDIHDIEYQYIIDGVNEGLMTLRQANMTQRHADKRFRANMFFLIEEARAKSKWYFIRDITAYSRIQMARAYYEAVKQFGWNAIKRKLT